jgi:tetratricopeptide (TPR) repeat protein
MIHSDLGNLGEALRLGAAAKEFYASVDDRTAVAKIDVNLGAALIRANEPLLALRHTWAATAHFRRTGGEFEQATCHENLAISLQALGRFRHARRHLQIAIDLLEPFDTPSHVTRRGDCLMALGSLLAKLGDRVHALEARLEARSIFLSLGRPYRLGKIEQNLGIAACASGTAESHEEGRRWFEMARQRFEQSENVWDTAGCLRLIAKSEVEFGSVSVEGTMDKALAAVRIIERHRYRIEAAQLRSSWLRREDRVYSLACKTALRAERPDVVAEVIETSRQQAPARALHKTQPVSEEDNTTPNPKLVRGEIQLDARGARRNAIVTWSGGAPLGPSRSISVNGVSRIHATDDVVPLEQLAAITAGTDGWVWGTFVQDNDLWWYTRDPTGTFDAGGMQFDDGSARTAVESLSAHTRGVSGADSATDFVVNGPLGAKLDESSLRKITSLIPDKLMSALCRSSRERPIVLAMAHDSFFASVPWTLVPVEPSASHPVVRLLELAVLRHVPPCGLTRRPTLVTRVETKRKVVLAVLDSRGDLRFARRTVRRAAALLIRADATRSAVVGALRSIKPGSPGVTVIASHVHQPDSHDALSTAISVYDGSLSADQLLDRESELGCTDRVLLAGCTTIGLGNREWFGVAAALMNLGASTVVASSWALLDDRATLAVDRAIVKRLCRGGNGPEAVRSVQLAMLDRTARRVQLPFPWQARPLPYHWAAYGLVESPM